MEEEVEFDYFQSVLIISLNRIYDAQMAILAQMAPEQAVKLSSLHEHGRTLAPDPAIYLED